MNSTYTLSSMVSKCQDCRYVGDSWESFCSVDKSHTMAQQWAWYSSTEREYKYSDSSSKCD